ncbi:helix-turn-helix domain-containing protein [Amycolatopsis magusensis]|uniref:Transcriptional regulator with XRE-family HTH domain n=1 Tax=Amycolatopsis magusensis TaxID=882444 RepID=A0ABS4Q0P3_9PSEU|nr:helix-turn-helix transcriptional regulator [Amycolatopsis magusensis]MBP2185242.1 transcriptional regulator with XRE-family HTH domain [Amycolatopsis magusensis]MDI5980652.1 helix-turn-helix transcriptional regulator [Amycolatopsis magusensis]
MSQPIPTERVQVAAVLRRLREQAGVTRGEAAELLGCTPSKIGDLELGRSGAKPAELEKLLVHYGAGPGQRTELIRCARDAHGRKPRGTYGPAPVPANLRRVLDLEAQARETAHYSGELVPPLLQVRAYAEALLMGESVKLVELRLSRRECLERTDRPRLRLRCVLAESVLRTGIGGRAVMAAQLTRLCWLNEAVPNVEIQVLPTGTGVHPFLGRTVTLHSFPPPAPAVLITDGHDRDVFCDRPAVVRQAAERFTALRARALSVRESSEFLRRLGQHWASTVENSHAR